jgi:hypothetical protein
VIPEADDSLLGHIDSGTTNKPWLVNMPAPAALAWYGGAGTTAALSELLVKFLDDFAGVKDNVRSLQLKVKDDLNLIGHYMSFIKDLPAGTTTTLDESILNDLASHLQPLMIKCETEIRSVQAATAGKTNVEAYTSRLAIRTVETLEKDLEAWVQRLHVRFTLLSERLKSNAAKAVSDQDPAMRFQHAMQALNAEFRTSRKEGQPVEYDDLWLQQPQNIDFGETPRKRRMEGNLAGSRVVVEFISYNAATSTELAQNAIGELAFILNRSDPSVFHVLKCKHLYKQPVINSSSQMYGLVLEMPFGLKTMRSLSEVITDVREARERNSHNVVSQTLPADARVLSKISSRIKLAFQLAMAVRYLHSFGYVHQSIRTSNVLVATFDQGNSAEGYLGGFERSRPNAAASNQKRIDADWRNNIYRSPERVATTNEETINRHTMSHDIYSLGVVLLELGIFEPLALKESRFKNQSAQIVRQNLMLLAKVELPWVMDDAYTNAVCFCLESTPDSWIGSHIAERRYVDEVIDPLRSLMQTR